MTIEGSTVFVSDVGNNIAIKSTNLDPVLKRNMDLLDTIFTNVESLINYIFFLI